MAARDGVAEAAVIGGQGVFAAALKSATRLYLTEVEARPEGDAFFPAFDEAEWIETGREVLPAGPQDDHPAVLRILDRHPRFWES
jgi:dihydrofolate reductase